ncbi:hypothetical protein A374_09094 [Fictibacillus macauensis ZFHKF-1]|uniref:Uncharacterized protein n=1 Tax=Fictibacillus macauensis ZFHKF-1 TaxID=1196324 RepID=I8UGI9_9BACL|nr:hypothetical protein [Fictibacillus macauensis]EIT85980.1 hypothetical protein A374_09094 [Fictibacillus macauensis ZFHKF-1]
MPIIQFNAFENDTRADIKFQSYFEIEKVISVCMIDEFDISNTLGVNALYEFMNDKHPFFYVFSVDDEIQYIYIKVDVK